MPSVRSSRPGASHWEPFVHGFGQRRFAGCGGSRHHGVSRLAGALHARGHWAQRQTLERLAQAALSQAVEHRSRVAFEGLVEIRSLMRDGTFARLDAEDLQALRTALESLDQYAPRNDE